jgi:putative transcriptional regulator
MNTFHTIRKRLDMTQSEIAAELGVSQSNVSFYENGQTVPPAVAGKLIALAKSRGHDISFDDVYAAAVASTRA